MLHHTSRRDIQEVYKFTPWPLGVLHWLSSIHRRAPPTHVQPIGDLRGLPRGVRKGLALPLGLAVMTSLLRPPQDRWPGNRRHAGPGGGGGGGEHVARRVKAKKRSDDTVWSTLQTLKITKTTLGYHFVSYLLPQRGPGGVKTAIAPTVVPP